MFQQENEKMIKRNIGQGFMQADVKTAKDIPLALFMELKAQYEGEMGKTGEMMMGVKNGGEGYAGMGGGVGFGSVAAAGGAGFGSAAPAGGSTAGKSCEYNEGGGRQSCGLGCKCRSYSTILSSGKKPGGGMDHGRGSSAGAMLNSDNKVEKWLNSKNEEIIVIDNKTIIFNDCRRSRFPKKSQVISHFPANIGVRYPKNLSKSIYELSESSEEEAEEEEDDEEEDVEPAAMGFRVGTLEFYHPNYEGGRVELHYNHPDQAEDEMGQDAVSGAAWTNEGDTTGRGHNEREDGIGQDGRDSEEWGNGSSQDGMVGVNGHCNGDIGNNAHFNDNIETGGSTTDKILGGNNGFCSNINGVSVDEVGRFPSTNNEFNGEASIRRLCNTNGGHVDDVVVGRFQVDVNGLNEGDARMERFSNNINGVKDAVEGLGRLYTGGNGCVEDIARFSVNVNGHNEAVGEIGAEFLGGTSGETCTDGRTMDGGDHFNTDAAGRATKVEFNDWDSDQSDGQTDRTTDYVNILKQVVNI